MFRNRSFSIWIAILAIFFSGALLPDAARADVTVTFYSHEFGESFPHAFYTVKGKLDNGQTVDDAHGFTAISVSPGILLGSVKGILKAPSTQYIAKSDSQFSVTISDAAYRKLMAKVSKWKAIPQKSYNLNKRN